jgi:hypothetical protein
MGNAVRQGVAAREKRVMGGEAWKILMAGGGRQIAKSFEPRQPRRGMYM